MFKVIGAFFKDVLYAFSRVCFWLYVTRKDWYARSQWHRDFLTASWNDVQLFYASRKLPLTKMLLDSRSVPSLLASSARHILWTLPSIWPFRYVLPTLTSVLRILVDLLGFCYYRWIVKYDLLYTRYQWHCFFKYLRALLPCEEHDILALPEQKFCRGKLIA
jgi:hypothetical protein